jgi:hypothetical protein
MQDEVPAVAIVLQRGHIPEDITLQMSHLPINVLCKVTAKLVIASVV